MKFLRVLFTLSLGGSNNNYFFELLISEGIEYTNVSLSLTTQYVYNVPE